LSQVVVPLAVAVVGSGAARLARESRKRS
jgi:hypothetical protein